MSGSQCRRDLGGFISGTRDRQMEHEIIRICGRMRSVQRLIEGGCEPAEAADRLAREAARMVRELGPTLDLPYLFQLLGNAHAASVSLGGHPDQLRQEFRTLENSMPQPANKVQRASRTAMAACLRELSEYAVDGGPPPIAEVRGRFTVSLIKRLLGSFSEPMHAELLGQRFRSAEEEERFFDEVDREEQASIESLADQWQRDPSGKSVRKPRRRRPRTPKEGLLGMSLLH